MSQALYFEDWEIGHVYETRSREVMQRDTELFAEVEGAKSAMHLDAEYAENTIWGKLTVHGLITVSMAAGLMGEMGMFDGTALAFLELGWKFTAPVCVGDEVRVSWWVSEKLPTSNPERGIVVREIEVLNQDGVVVCTGTMKTLWTRRTPQAAAVS